MPEILHADSLVVTVDKGNLGQITSGTVTSPDGALIATLGDAAGPLRRSWGSVSSYPGSYRPSTWHVRDANGERILVVEKARGRGLRGARPEAFLANGRALGRAIPVGRPELPTHGDIDLLNPDGVRIGDLPAVTAEQDRDQGLHHRVRDPGQSVVGEIRFLVDGQLGHALHFEETAGIHVRALALAWVLTLGM